MKIRKQDEAPALGADSSLKFCNTRNKRYEQRKRDEGLMKVTLWIPSEREAEFKQLAEACCKYRHLSFNTLRDTQSGKYVSLERL